MRRRPTWVLKFNIWVAPEAIRPGVWKRRDGGFLVRKRFRHKRTGKRDEIRRVLSDINDPDLALAELIKLVDQAQEGREPKSAAQEIPSLIDYALSLFERKCTDRSLKSAKAIKRWSSVIELHLAPAKFAQLLLDQIQKLDIEEERTKWAALVEAGQYSPVTVNDWLSILRTIFNQAVADYRLDHNPVMHVEDLDTSEHRTYTKEQPNSLTADEVPAFIRTMLDRWPQHFAMTALGYGAGLRPSHMRPLRRRGPETDVLWEVGLLLIRRSQTYGGKSVGSIVLERTKTAQDQEIGLPEDLLAILEWHVRRLEQAPLTIKTSDLLFPSATGSFRSPSCLDKPFADVCEHLRVQTLWVWSVQLLMVFVLELPETALRTSKRPFKKRITPRGMRRTFKDLARAAKVQKVVELSVSGHADEKMDRIYSTVTAEEQRQELAKIVSLAGYRAALEATKTR